jgi:diadenylate cyclase
MSFQNYLRIPRVVDIESTEKIDAIRELVRELCKTLRISRRQKAFVDEILKREEAASTFIGQGIAIPHLRADIKGDFAIAVGRSASGVKYDAARGALAYIIVLVITNEKADNAEHLQIMSEVATFFKNDMVREKIRNDPTTVDFGELSAVQGGVPAEDKTAKVAKKTSQPVLNAAVDLAKDIKATALMVFADTVRDNDFLDALKNRGKVIVVTNNKSRFDADDKRIAACIQAPSYPASRTGQVRVGMLLALSRNLIDNSDKVVCISGNSRVGSFDTIVAIDVSSEYELFFTNSPSLLPPDIMPEVLERILGLAGEIAVEGREGKPLGTIFVLGDTNTVNKFVTQLIINPFRGYSEAERNIIDPALAETVKEFASIDGAFVITGDGIVLSAGSYLRPQAEVELLPSGFGSRHAAAAGITACTKALAITVSESTGMVTLFKNGAIVLTISKPVEREKGTVHTYL